MTDLSQTPEKPTDPRFIDEAGNRYGRLLVISFHKHPSKTSYWRCLCDCGKEHIASRTNLRNGDVRSCGCLKAYVQSQPRTHGFSGTRVHRQWKSMRKRCRSSNSSDYRHYGGRGIKVCERWEEFSNFLSDMGPPPDDKSTIERINNDGNYEPSNCRWATQSEQVLNTRRTVYVEHNGQKVPLHSLLKNSPVSREGLKRRLSIGWSLEKALSVPSRTRKKRVNRPRIPK